MPYCVGTSILLGEVVPRYSAIVTGFPLSTWVRWSTAQLLFCAWLLKESDKVFLQGIRLTVLIHAGLKRSRV